MSTIAQQEISTPTPAAPSTPRSIGNFVWYELRTPDAKGAEDFYTHVVGWKTKSFGDPNAPYTLLSAGGPDMAGMMQMTPEMAAGGATPAWVGFIGVDDVDAYARRVEEAGGKLHIPPQDIPTVGRFASAEDPQGAEFLLFKGNLSAPPPRDPAGTPGTVGWHELSANEEQSAWNFYSNLFGWTEDSTMDMGPAGTYRMFNNGGGVIGGMMTRDQSTSPGPFWNYYFNVEDIDAAGNRIKEKGGKLMMGPHEVPGGLWIILGFDPQGVFFSVVGPRKQ
ncbi:MAG TPA: VOC family protein [Acidisarcina sp.]